SGIIVPFMTTLVTGGLVCLGAWGMRGFLAAGGRAVRVGVGVRPGRVRTSTGSGAPPRRRPGARCPDRPDGDTRATGAALAPRARACLVSPPGAAAPRRATLPRPGSANAAEVWRAPAGQVERAVYAPPVALFGAASLEPRGPIKDDAPPRPATRYGVYKVANE